MSQATAAITQATVQKVQATDGHATAEEIQAKQTKGPRRTLGAMTDKSGQDTEKCSNKTHSTK